MCMICIENQRSLFAQEKRRAPGNPAPVSNARVSSVGLDLEPTAFLSASIAAFLIIPGSECFSHELSFP